MYIWGNVFVFFFLKDFMFQFSGYQVKAFASHAGFFPFTVLFQQTHHLYFGFICLTNFVQVLADLDCFK